MKYEILVRAALVAECQSMTEALEVVRGRIAGKAPYEAAMCELAVVKRDARGRKRREVSGRDLVALALGEPRGALFPTERGMAVLDDAAAAGWPVELALVPDGAWHQRGRWSLVARITRAEGGALAEPESVVLWVARTRAEVEGVMRQAEARLSALSLGPARRPDQLAWPVRLTVYGQSGLTLWLEGDADVLLARDGRVPLFTSPDTLGAEVLSTAASFSLTAVARIDEAELRAIVQGDPLEVDFDRAAAWLANPDREPTREACEATLNALNMAIDVGATVGDGRLAELVDAPPLAAIHDALTFGLTLLGDGAAFRENPAVMASAVTPDAAEAGRALFALVREHLEILE